MAEVTITMVRGVEGTTSDGDPYVAFYMEGMEKRCAVAIKQEDDDALGNPSTVEVTVKTPVT